ncbi:MAG: hypothetical protein AAGA77_02625 [Bacteroidota bacterium]
MFKKINSKFLLGLLMVTGLSIGFFSCGDNEALTTQEDEIAISLFKQELQYNTQRFVAQDEGEGTYSITGEQGTRVKIKNALVNSRGERVRGEVEIELIEIYSVADMILNRKQTLADYDGQPEILESGGEIFIQVYQDGEKLSADGNGDMRIYLPTENTGGAREGMELFYGEEVEDQVIWKPTGKPVKVVENQSRNAEEYLVIIQDILGWINVDIIFGAGGEEVECVEVVINCPELCGGEPGNTVVAINVPNVNSAFELTYDPDTGSYKICGGAEGPLPLGGLTVNLIIVIECPDGTVMVAIITVTINVGYHLEIVNCSDFVNMSDPGQFAQALQQL